MAWYYDGGSILQSFRDIQSSSNLRMVGNRYPPHHGLGGKKGRVLGLYSSPELFIVLPEAEGGEQVNVSVNAYL
ncbi:uncharacterized protein Bfra_000412 [Botrytis fragariae]|uniref:Uncharacterized protein n=1 Tax=Botrytis fragariae TaxID=1964551 RepID=A0A8H6B2J1_9HELO|nr:uncharacterized protein Bfra_000412 [Botrytis fragariae]KAF5878246.1 hypothetical protein Bfra_000412 [Botrytis fragariae]